ncbi:MAG: hypothetical protein JEZ04_06555 [Spirochaetales bacterium]|nr:hypothetical protein [Spirochaetales bacterium]
MSLYWKDLEIVPGMMLAVDQYQHEAFDSAGNPVAVMWKILSFGSRTSNEAYLDYSTGKKYPLEKVIKKKKLQARLNRDILQLPACSDFMVVQEYHDGKEVYKRCYNLDMLVTVRNIRVVDEI